MEHQQTRESRGRKGLPDSADSALSSRTNTHGLPPKPVRDSEKRKRSPAPVAPEDRHILTPWLASMTQSTFMTTNQRLHEEIVAYVAYVQATPQETTARQALLDVIQKTLKRRFPDGEVKLFGSGATGLCLPTGDMDLVVMTKEEIVEKKRPLFQMSTILKAARLTWDVQVNFRAKVPILTFKSLPEYGSFSVDIGINNIDGPQAIAVVNEYLSKMPALRPLILIVKGFLSQRNLNSAAHSGLGSYAVICMCISFLQLNPSKRPQDYIDKPMETESLGALLADFMFYYGIEFPYATSYISVTEGKLLPKESAKWITNKAPDGLAIQCLINPENDVGKSAGRLEAIRSAFKEGYATILQLSMTDTSLLGPLVSLTESTLNHRAHIQHIVDSGRLQAAVSPPPRHPKHKPIPVPAQPKPAHKPAPHLTHTPPAHLPPRPSPSLRAPPVPTILPYGMAFGAGSVMGRNTRTHAYSPHDGGAINRKGSGFASGMHEEQLYMPPVAPHPHPEFDSEWPPRGRGGGGGATRRARSRPQKRRKFANDVGGGGVGGA